MPAKITPRANNRYLLCVERGRDDLGKRLTRFSKTVTAKNIKDAEKKWIEFYMDCQSKKTALAESPTLDQFYEYYLENYVAVNSLEDATILDIDNNYSRLSKSLGHIPIDKIDVKKINAYIRQVTDDTYLDRKAGKQVSYSGRVIKSRIRILKTLLRQAYLWEFLVVNISDKIVMPRIEESKKKKVIEESELVILLDAIESSSLKHRLWVYLTFSLGIRRGELFGLQWDDIDGNVLTIARSITQTNFKDEDGQKTKTEASRRKLYLSDEILKMLYEYRSTLKGAKAGSKWIFPNSQGGATMPSAFRNFLDRIRNRAHNSTYVLTHIRQHTTQKRHRHGYHIW